MPHNYVHFEKYFLEAPKNNVDLNNGKCVPHRATKQHWEKRRSCSFGSKNARGSKRSSGREYRSKLIILSLVKVCKMVFALHHTITNHRFLLYPNFSNKIQRITAGQVRDKCKFAEALEATSQELKAPSTSNTIQQ